MKLSIVAAVATLAASAMAKNYIVSFDSETPQSTVDSAMKQVIAAGGHITHVYGTSSSHLIAERVAMSVYGFGFGGRRLTEIQT